MVWRVRAIVGKWVLIRCLVELRCVDIERWLFFHFFLYFLKLLEVDLLSLFISLIILVLFLLQLHQHHSKVASVVFVGLHSSSMPLKTEQEVSLLVEVEGDLLASKALDLHLHRQL